MEKKQIVNELVKAIKKIGYDEKLNYSANTVAEYLFKQLESFSWLAEQQRLQKAEEGSLPLVVEPIAEGPSEEETVVNDFVDRMYALYPTRCPKRNASLGKSRTDKLKIRKLLKTYTMEEIEQVIRSEVDGSYGVHYMKNFSTFLNNFPEPQEINPVAATATIGTPKSDVVVINGVVYK